MNDKNAKALERIQTEIDKIDKKASYLYFFVMDTKGNPSGSVEYVYNLALFAKEAGYNVAMVYQTQDKKEEYVGIDGWLGEKYTEIPHYNLLTDNVEIGASDILFIPEIFFNVMNQTQNLPCKRVAIMQNFDHILAQTPFSTQWGNVKILDAIVNTEENEALLKSIFPYVKTTVVHPFINKMFGETKEPKKLMVNIISRDPDDTTRIAKPFYWKYPLMKWITFRDLRGYSKQDFATKLRESPITIWIDDEASFGYSPLEALQSGNIVFAKIPNETKSWMMDKEGKNLNKSFLWFNNINDIHENLMRIIRSWIIDNIDYDKMFEDKDDVLSRFSEEKSREEFIKFVEDTLDKRKTDMEAMYKIFEAKKEDNDNAE